jgi:cytidine deaminase
MSKKITAEQIKTLAQAASAAQKNSYSPYSHFKVGAAVLAADGKIYTGTNIENASFGLTICAERSAIFSAVCNGQKNILALALCTDPVKGKKFGTPCGACRQVMTEFMKADAPVILVAKDKRGSLEIFRKPLKNFMPYSFTDF